MTQTGLSQSLPFPPSSPLPCRQSSRLSIMNNWIQVCIGATMWEDSTGTRAPPSLLSHGKGNCWKCAHSLNALIKNRGPSFCLTPFKTSQSRARRAMCEQPHVGMEMSAEALAPLCDFSLTVENQQLLEPCNLVLLIIIMVF